MRRGCKRRDKAVWRRRYSPVISVIDVCRCTTPRDSRHYRSASASDAGGGPAVSRYQLWKYLIDFTSISLVPEVGVDLL